ncbi:MAG: hypothetical protein ACK2UO_17440 [Caldilineaceae bacterium]|jgi:hypothetical protein
MKLATGIAVAICVTLHACATPRDPPDVSDETVRAKLACNVRDLCRNDPEPQACFAVNYEHQLAVYYGKENEIYGKDYNTDYGDILAERQAELLNSACSPF